MNKTKGFTKYKKMRYMPGLDGLRTIAVLGIIIYHLNKQWLTGGFLGVDTFFCDLWLFNYKLITQRV